MKRSYLTGRRVKSLPTGINQSSVSNYSKTMTGQVHTKCRFRYHSLPSLLRGLLPCLHNLEHLLLCNPPNLWQRNTELCRFLGPLILDSGR